MERDKVMVAISLTKTFTTVINNPPLSIIGTRSQSAVYTDVGVTSDVTRCSHAPYEYVIANKSNEDRATLFLYLRLRCLLFVLFLITRYFK